MRHASRAGGVIVMAALALAGTAGSSDRQRPVLVDSFSRPNGPNNLITNEFATYNRFDPGAVRSPRWEMTSGSLFSRNGVGWSGNPDLTVPDAHSSNGTDSAVFRLHTRRANFGNVRVEARIRVLRWSPVRPDQLPAVVLWVRYKSERHLYWLSVLCADGSVDIEKKVPGGPHPVNGGTYYIFRSSGAKRRWPVELGRWYRITVTVRTRRGKVSIATYRDGTPMRRSIDRGPPQLIQDAETGSLVRNPAPPIAGRGRLGIRADNAEFELRSYRVSRLR